MYLDRRDVKEDSIRLNVLSCGCNYCCGQKDRKNGG